MDDSIGTEVQVLSTNSDSYQLPDHGCVNTAVGDNFGVTMHPVRLAFDGVRCDYALFLARLAYDYAMENPILNVDYALSAIRLASFALRVIANWGRLFIHELGHTYCGRGHCNWDCCFDTASYAWLCKVRGLLGLPGTTDWPTYVGDTDGSDEACTEDENYGLVSLSTGIYTRCNVVEYGIPGQQSHYCATPCMTLVWVGPHGAAVNYEFCDYPTSTSAEPWWSPNLIPTTHSDLGSTKQPFPKPKEVLLGPPF